MKKIKEYKLIIIIALLVLGFIFYWFEIRPAQIREKCINAYSNAFNEIVSDDGRGGLYGSASINSRISENKGNYEKCLIENGLEN